MTATAACCFQRSFHYAVSIVGFAIHQLSGLGYYFFWRLFNQLRSSFLLPPISIPRNSFVNSSDVFAPTFPSPTKIIMSLPYSQASCSSESVPEPPGRITTKSAVNAFIWLRLKGSVPSFPLNGKWVRMTISPSRLSAFAFQVRFPSLFSCGNSSALRMLIRFPARRFAFKSLRFFSGTPALQPPSTHHRRL